MLKNSLMITLMAGKCQVVVTGLGPISAVGTGKDAFWKNLVAGETGIGRIQGFDPSPFTSQVGTDVVMVVPQWCKRGRIIVIHFLPPYYYLPSDWCGDQGF